MSEPPELAALRRSTAALLRHVDELATVKGFTAARSGLPGWTRGHVLAHLAGNADSNATAMAGALVGTPQPSYAGGDARRDSDIAARARRPAAELVGLLHAACSRLDAVFSDVGAADAWAAPTLDRDTCADCVHFRWREVEIHHVDLACGYHPSDWPAEFVRRLLPGEAAALAGRSLRRYRLTVNRPSTAPELIGAEFDTAALGAETAASGAQSSVEFDAESGAATLIAAPDHALLAWLIGRAVDQPDGLGSWPALPEWD